MNGLAELVVQTISRVFFQRETPVRSNGIQVICSEHTVSQTALAGEGLSENSGASESMGAAGGEGVVSVTLASGSGSDPAAGRPVCNTHSPPSHYAV